MGRYFAQDERWDAANAVVLVVSPRAVLGGRAANPLNFSVATKLTQKLQYLGKVPQNKGGGDMWMFPKIGVPQNGLFYNGKS